MAETEVHYYNTNFVTKKNIEAKLNCSICKKNFQEPKLLPCFHTFCKIPCLERMVVQGAEGQSLTCPTCRYKIPLPENGVNGLQTNFQVENALKERQTLRRNMKKDCENCKKMAAYKYCQQCKKFMCEKCLETHQMWGDFSQHKLFDADNLKIPPRRSIISLRCNGHPDVEAKLYCETCSELICNQCTLHSHQGHTYSLKNAAFPKIKEELMMTMRPLKEKQGKVLEALNAFDTLSKEINDQRAAIEADIDRELDQLHDTLDQRRIELVASLDSYAQQKLQQVAMHRDHVCKTHEKMSSCLEYAETGLKTGTDDEVIKMKGLILKRIKEVTGEFDPRSIHPQTKADIQWLPNNQVSRACKEFGDVACSSIDSEMIYDNLDFEVSSNPAYQTVSTDSIKKQDSIQKESEDDSLLRKKVPPSPVYHTVNRSRGSVSKQGSIQEEPVNESSHYKEVPPRPAYRTVISRGSISRQSSTQKESVDDSSHYKELPPRPVYDTVNKSRGSISKQGSIQGQTVDDSSHYKELPPRPVYDTVNRSRGSISKQGSIQEQTMDDSSHYKELPPRPVYDTVNRSRGSVSKQSSIQGQTVDESSHYKTLPCRPTVSRGSISEEETMNLESSHYNVVPSRSTYPRATSQGSVSKQVSSPEKPVDVSLYHKILSLEAPRKPARILGDLNRPFGVATNSKSQIILVITGKYCVLVMDYDGEVIATFGKQGTKKGQFKRPCGVTVDQSDNIYIVDTNNHRIQKFTPEGKLIASVGSPGSGRLQFAYPIGICFNETNHHLYVCDQANSRIQVLSTNLTFMKSFGELGTGDGKLNYPKHVTFDQSSNLYVTDCGNNRVQVFTADGQFLRTFSSKASEEILEKPFAIAVDSNDIVYVSELNRHCVNKYTSQGEYISSFGRSGSEEGLFQDIGCLCVFGTSLLVADTSNNRLQMF